MLTDALRLLSPTMAHRLMRLLGIKAETFHDWIEGLCPCEASS